MATRPAEMIRCRNEGCEQVIAKRHESGDVRPVVVGAFIDNRGRLTVICPACQTKTRIDHTRRA